MVVPRGRTNGSPHSGPHTAFLFFAMLMASAHVFIDDSADLERRCACGDRRRSPASRGHAVEKRPSVLDIPQRQDCSEHSKLPAWIPDGIGLFGHEFLDLIPVRTTVENLTKPSTQIPAPLRSSHTDSIVTECGLAHSFLTRRLGVVYECVHSLCRRVLAMTWAPSGNSTNRTHARGPSVSWL